jgi:hypothetical protein
MSITLQPVPNLFFTDLSADERPQFAEVLTLPVVDEDAIELGGAWFALHYLLSGEVPFPRTEAERRSIKWLGNPLEDALMGGADADLPDAFGGARFHSPTEVARIAEALREVTAMYMRTEYDAQELADHDIPAPAEDDEEAVEALIRAMERLSAFYTHCEAQSAGVLIRIA